MTVKINFNKGTLFMLKSSTVMLLKTIKKPVRYCVCLNYNCIMCKVKSINFIHTKSIMAKIITVVSA